MNVQQEEEQEQEQEQEQQAQQDFPRPLIITDELIERIKRQQKEERSPEAIRERKRIRKLENQVFKMEKEVENKPVTKTRNLKLQRILQIIEQLGGKAIRARYAAEWLDMEFERWKEDDRKVSERTLRNYMARIVFLKDMSFRRGDVYADFMWD